MDEKTRIYLRFLRHEIRERAIDLLHLAWPIFAVVGMIVLSAKVWLWIVGGIG